MNGPAHYREADNCVRQGCAADERGAQADAMAWLALGQIHATLALAAAYAAGGAIMRLEDRDGRDRSTDTTQVYTLLADQVADTEIRAIYNPRPGEPAGKLQDPPELCGLPDRQTVEAHLLARNSYSYGQGQSRFGS